MNSQPEAPAVPCPAPGRKRLAVLWLASATFLLVVLGWFFALRPLAGNNLIWLTPAQFAKATRQSPFTWLKIRIARVIGPLGLLNWRVRPNILIRSSVMEFTNDAIQLGLPASSSATNADGTRVWILSAAELKVLHERLKITPSTPTWNISCVTRSGTQVSGSAGDAPPPGAGSDLVGLKVDLSPKFVSGSIKVTLAAASTEKTQAWPGNLPVVRTNLAVACRASLPNAGALLVDAGPRHDAGGTNYWLIVSPTAVDARGNPL